LTRDKDHFEDYPVLSEIKLSPNERADIWHSIEQAMERTRIHKTKRGITMIKTSAAVVSVLVFFGSYVGYEVHHTRFATKPGVTTASHSHYASEIAWIKNKGYSVNGATPNATVKTASGSILTAWIAAATQSQDGYNQFVFFFLNGRYIGTDTAKPSLEITSAKAAGQGIAVTYPVYRKSDSFANPTGTPVTITYTWNGSRLVPNKPYPKQFQASSAASQGNNSISTKSYPTSAEVANQIASIQGGNGVGPGSPMVNLGNGITARESAGMGHARYVWQEGNWTIQIRYYTRNSSAQVKQVAENIVSYLHTHRLPAPNKHGVIVVNSMDANTTSFRPQTIVAWQEGTQVNQLQQTGNPVQTMETIVNNASNATSQGNNLISTTSYSTTAQAASQVEQKGGAFSASGQRINLGRGITAWGTAGMEHARYEWREGNWNIEIRFYTVNRGVKDVAENMVSYLHTHLLPAPNNHGVILVQSTAPNSTAFKWKTVIAWQEGTKVNELQQTGNPIQALQTAVKHK